MKLYSRLRSALSDNVIPRLLDERDEARALLSDYRTYAHDLRNLLEFVGGQLHVREAHGGYFDSCLRPSCIAVFELFASQPTSEGRNEW